MPSLIRVSDEESSRDRQPRSGSLQMLEGALP
jgi:hypothetical protein